MNNNMKNKRIENPTNNCETEEARQAYYRTCIAEFQVLGYQEQYLAELNDDLVPILGVNAPEKS